MQLPLFTNQLPLEYAHPLISHLNGGGLKEKRSFRSHHSEVNRTTLSKVKTAKIILF